jgi:Zn-dependent peptidase ImmA (M78 family)
MPAQKANINPEMLNWARVEAGLSLAEAAQQAKIADLKSKTAEERLDEWEKGEDYPTQNQLTNISKAYYRPVLTFYLPTPPAPNADVADFRTVADDEIGNLSPKLRALVSKMKARQQEILDLLIGDEDDEEPEQLPFIGRFKEDQDVVTVARDIEDVLGLALEQRRHLNGNDALLRLIRSSAEEAGVYVIAQGDLGSYHTDIAPSVFRGFALADPIAPFVVLNDNDAKPAQTFTLIHELAHLWIGDTGISNYDPFGERGEVRDDAERFCNEVSAEFLMPQEAVLHSWNERRAMPVADGIREIAANFGVSRAAVGIRLWKLNKLEDQVWWPLYASYEREWDAVRARRADNQGEAPPLYYPMKKSQLGGLLINTVLNALDAGRVTYTRASRILDASPNSFENLRRRA